MANEIVREIEIDVARENTFTAILAKQYDHATRYLLVTVTNRGERLVVDPNSTITINFERPHQDNEPLSDYQAVFSGSVIDGKLRVPIPYWALERDGDVKADISMVVGTNRLTTLGFVIEVEPSAYNGNAIRDDEEYDLLTGLIIQVQHLRNTITATQTNYDEAEAARVLAENARVEAETARATAENTRQTNETARGTAESSRASAEEARATAETNRATAEATRVSNETARQTAETARATAEGERAVAETSRDTAEAGRVQAENSRVEAENARAQAEIARQTTYDNLADAMETSIETIDTAVRKAEAVEEIANTMQILFSYDSDGYPCFEEKTE